MGIKQTMVDAGHAVADAAASAGRTAADAASAAAGFVKEQAGFKPEQDMGLMGVREHMPVIGQCGGRVGTVDAVEGNSIKLTRADSGDGKHHYIPSSWVERVDEHVHLSRDAAACRAGWKTESGS